MTLCCLVSIPVAVFGEDMTEPGVQASSQAEASVPVIDDSAITKVDDMVTVAEDTDVLDYPGRKEGSAIGEVLEGDEISRTGTIDDIWSQIVYEDDNGAEQTGYITTPISLITVLESIIVGIGSVSVIVKDSGFFIAFTCCYN